MFSGLMFGHLVLANPCLCQGLRSCISSPSVHCPRLRGLSTFDSDSSHQVVL